MISSPEDRKKLKNALQEISNSLTRVEAERDLIKDIVKNLSEEFELSKKVVSKMARIYHKQNFSEEKQAFEDLETLYEEVINPQSTGA